MPLRDHFRPPTATQLAWEELHGQWPAVIVQQLKPLLPKGFVAGPKVHAGARIEVDIATYQKDDSPDYTSRRNGGVAVVTWQATEPTLRVLTDLPDYDEFEVRIYDTGRGRTLVAAIELVSPANKDRPESRNAFISKCFGLLQKGVSVIIVDLVTTRQANLYVELIGLFGQSDPSLGSDVPQTYAASCHWVPQNDRAKLEAWAYPLSVGEPLPTVPLWLKPELVMPLELETSYQKACDDLSIT